ncbi:hypothetical protein [Neobacillus niacini]|uniref:hypothetical protein n=1 Tax=Neobacillus niacini TaxID=86668 RepID=UPI00203FDB34|nr:hypothetical protein [Neobacillus niacini]MCM3692184.1 hypothetical protein [Neobacillus niacini]
MDMVEVFEELVIKAEQQKLMQTLEKLRVDEPIRRKFRELADVSTRLRRLNEILKESISMDKESRKKWVSKRDGLRERSDKLYSEIEEEGFEHWWVTIIVNNEAEKLDEFMDKARESAYKEHFGEISIKDIEILDNRWGLVEKQLNQAKVNYIEGK